MPPRRHCADSNRALPALHLMSTDLETGRAVSWTLPQEALAPGLGVPWTMAVVFGLSLGADAEFSGKPPRQAWGGAGGRLAQNMPKMNLRPTGCPRPWHPEVSSSGWGAGQAGRWSGRGGAWLVSCVPTQVLV